MLSLMPDWNCTSSAPVALVAGAIEVTASVVLIVLSAELSSETAVTAPPASVVTAVTV